jgi:hypothetical protein
MRDERFGGYILKIQPVKPASSPVPGYCPVSLDVVDALHFTENRELMTAGHAPEAFEVIPS